MHRKKIRLELSAFLGLDVALPEVVDGWPAFSTRDEVHVSRVKHEPLSTKPLIQGTLRLLLITQMCSSCTVTC